jgi:tetraacyldisaccharide 4'-kinase
MARRDTSHRVIRWLWTSRRPGARLARLALLPLAGVWRGAMTGRALAYRKGWRATSALPLPAIAVGNLTVGGSGKTPLASWIAAVLAGRGHRPGILLRGYRGGDEAALHREQVPEAVVVADPDRVAGAERALALGADVLVLDDAYQRLDVRRDLNVAVVSAETARAVRWPLPAGPWREGLGALGRADFLVVTRRRADLGSARRLAADLAARLRPGIPCAIVHLAVREYTGMLSGRPVPAADLSGRRVVAASAIGDPEAFIAQTKATGALVQAATWRDHHAFDNGDLAWLARAARKADHLVVTRKDAVKLRDRWPAGAPEPLVATLDLHWEEGRDALVRAVAASAAPLDAAPAGGHFVPRL